MITRPFLFAHAARVCLAILHLDCLNTFVLSLETQWHSAAWSMYDHPAILPMQLLSCHIVFHGLYIEFPGNMALGHFAHVQYSSSVLPYCVFIVYILSSETILHSAAWSRGMILASGASGPGFKSPSGPFFLFFVMH